MEMKERNVDEKVAQKRLELLDRVMDFIIGFIPKGELSFALLKGVITPAASISQVV